MNTAKIIDQQIFEQIADQQKFVLCYVHPNGGKNDYVDITLQGDRMSYSMSKLSKALSPQNITRLKGLAAIDQDEAWASYAKRFPESFSETKFSTDPTVLIWPDSSKKIALQEEDFFAEFLPC